MSGGLVAVTGGTGFLGRAVVAGLAAEGWRLRVLARTPTLHVPTLPGPTLDVHVAGSLEDEAALARLVEGADIVVHCAGLIQARDARAFHAVNVDGAKRLGRAVRAHAPAARLVVVSSLAAREPLLSPYAASKAAGEAALLHHCGGDDWLVLRPSALYGPADRATLPVFRAALLPLLPVPGCPGARLSLLHVDDCAAAIVAACRCRLRQVVWEIGEGAHDWPAIGRAAARAVGRDPAMVSLPPPLLAVGVALLRLVAAGRSPLASPGKLAELLHADWTCRPDHCPPEAVWRPTIGLEAGFAATAQWYRTHGWL